MLAEQPLSDTNVFRIQSVEVNGRPLKYTPGNDMNLGPFPRNIVIQSALAPDATHRPLRVRCKIDGVDSNWREGGGEMNVTVLFSRETGDKVDQKKFNVHGDSSGWTGSLESSTLTHRRETMTVPKGATRLQLIISSAGPPSTTGIYVIDNFTVSHFVKKLGKFEILLHSPSFDPASGEGLTGWEPSGDRPSMAKIVDIGLEPKTKALAIVDDDPLSHVDWLYTREYALKVVPDDPIVVEWNEMFSIGESDNRVVEYDSLPPGLYQFHIAEATLAGKPTGVETTVMIRVPVALWEKPWFWASLCVAAIGAFTLMFRYVAKQKLQRTMIAFKQQHALEAERLRIARDIHDDLGARVTQISLLSAMAETDASFPEKAKAKFDQISTISRELVSALYETVWTVSPENDNLDAVVNYLCERINEFCDQAQLKCRLYVAELPKNIIISSRVRHSIAMAVTETMNNVVKHARASQVTVDIHFQERLLTISIRDDGKGFDLATAPSGNGLGNMRHRMEEISGTCTIQSESNKGTTVQLQMDIGANQKTGEEAL